MTDEQKKLEFTAQISNNQKILRKICHFYGTDQEDRQDLFQEMVAQLWKSYSTFSGRAKFTTWLYRVALNTALYHLRKKRKQKLTQERAEVLYQSYQPSDHMVEDLKSLCQAINQLNKIDKAIILLFLEQKSYQEMAEILGISKSNVSVRLLRAKGRLSTLFKNPGNNEEAVL